MKNHLRESYLRQIQLTPENFNYRKAIGVEIECFSYDEIPSDKIPHWVRKDSDGSIEPDDCDGGQEEAEFRVLTPTYYMESRIKRFCRLLRKHRYKTNGSCGLHVHFDMRDKTYEQALRLAYKIDRWLEVLQGLVEDDRRDGDWSRFGIDEEHKYQAVNISSYKHHRTIEIRLLEGTTDDKKITNWIKLIQAIIKVRYRNPKSDSCLEALKELPLEKNVKNYWTNRYSVLN